MKIRAVRRHRSECPDSQKLFIEGDGAAISVGTEYEVHAIAFYKGVILFQIVSDRRCPTWYPSALFEVTNRACPIDWQCNIFTDEKIDQILAIGPQFIVETEDAYNSMVEMHDDQVNLFWNRITHSSGTD